MKISLLIKRILLSSAVAASLFVPGLTTSAISTSQSMEDMGHARTDLVDCLERHQTPTASIDKESKQRDSEEDDEEPTPPAVPYFVAFQKPIVEPLKPVVNLLGSPSFIPPDIIILTTQLRI